MGNAEAVAKLRDPRRLVPGSRPQPVIDGGRVKLYLAGFETARQGMKKGDGISAARYSYAEFRRRGRPESGPDGRQNMRVGRVQEHPSFDISSLALCTAGWPGNRTPTSPRVTQAWSSWPRRPSAAPSWNRASGATGPSALAVKLAR